METTQPRMQAGFSFFLLHNLALGFSNGFPQKVFLHQVGKKNSFKFLLSVKHQASNDRKERIERKKEKMKERKNERKRKERSPAIFTFWPLPSPLIPKSEQKNKAKVMTFYFYVHFHPHVDFKFTNSAVRKNCVKKVRKSSPVLIE